MRDLLFKFVNLLAERLVLRLKFFHLFFQNRILRLECARCKKMLDKIEHDRSAPNSKVSGASHDD